MLDGLKTIRFVVRDETIAKIYARYLMEVIPLPDKAVKVAFDAQFSADQFQRIRKGFMGDQDNKWFMYFDAPWFYIFRAGRWVGQCWWFLKFEQIGDEYSVVEAWADSESLQWLKQDFSECLYRLIDECLPSGGEYQTLMDDVSVSFCILRKGRVKLEINSESISVADMRDLGARLIELADSLTKKSDRQAVS